MPQRRDSARGRGQAAGSPRRPRRLSRPEAGRLAVPRRGGLILLVDDSVHTRDMYSEYLHHRGFSVISAADGESALAMAYAVRPDVIVMDIAMPGLDGIAATRRLKGDPRTRLIPVVVLTGYAYRAIQQGALEAGAEAFLTKPCLPEDLESRIRSLLPTRPD